MRWLRGIGLAVLLLAVYVVALRPARLWVSAHLAAPALQQIDTPRARTLALVRIARRPHCPIPLPGPGLTPDVSDAGLQGVEQDAEPPPWAAPVGVIFLLPAMFLAALFPSRPYWAYLLAYHVVLGLTSFLVFAAGVAWWAPAFGVYTFARTYLAETVSLAVPLLLALAARGDRPAAADEA